MEAQLKQSVVENSGFILQIATSQFSFRQIVSRNDEKIYSLDCDSQTN
ncbi:hypothetical protein SAMN05660776_1266 [Salegentibacter holothuriorum]|uniref:Uncharacterized protein n=1 Tax=Salegentibacter holothuriorum TaxID=241145 RepID=A0A1T5BKS0_9FLAO|nr:hypothetical protein SAMN05660776_1266 [Salegentibacter holothuriorum]